MEWKRFKELHESLPKDSCCPQNAMLLDNGVLQATFYNTSVAGLRKWAKAVGKQFNYPIESIYMQLHEDGSITAQFEPKLGTPVVPDSGKLWFVDRREKRIINADWVKVSL